MSSNKKLIMSLLSIPIVAAITIALVLQTSPKQKSSIDEASAWKNLPEAVKAARTSHKKILIDVYTSWCTWCKKMDKDVYNQNEVEKYLNDHFERVKLNAESDAVHEFRDGKYSEKQIASAFGVDGYPTTIFLSADAETITSVPGYLPKNTFLAVLEYINNEEYKTMNWEEYSKKKGVE